MITHHTTGTLTNTEPAVKHGGGSIVLWGCSAASGTGASHKVDELMKEEDHLQILRLHLKSTANLDTIGCSNKIQIPKHTSKLVLERIKQSNIKLLEWPSQSLDLNPIKNLWTKLKSQLCAGKTTSLNEPYQYSW